jgi:arylsulfatase A-like enzyme
MAGMNVLVVVADALHLGYLGCYGNEWIDTPHFDRLAAEAVVFDQHYSNCPDAVGARRAWRSGCYHFTRKDSCRSQVTPAADLLHLLRAGGVFTCLVQDSDGPGREEFSAGWDRVAGPSDEEEPLKAALAQCARVLDDLAERDRWLLWLGLSTLRSPTTVPDEFRQMYAEDGEAPDTDIGRVRLLQDCYAGAVSYVDAALGQLLEELQARGLDGQTWLVVTTDRGQVLGEHGRAGPERPRLHDELIHLPLLVRLPGGAEAGRRVVGLTQPVDLLPTLLNIFALPAPPVHGHNLHSLLHEEMAAVRSYAVSGMETGATWEGALRSPEWSFLLPLRVPDRHGPHEPQLFVKPDDRWEVNNVAQHHPALAEHLAQVLRDFVELTHGPGPLEPPPLRDVEAEPVEPSGERS